MRRAWLLIVCACSSHSDPPPPPPPIASTPRDAAIDAPTLPAIFARLEAHSAGYTEPAGDPRLVPWRAKDKWGYADRTRKVVIPPRFDRAGLFHDGRAAVRIGERCGIIDSAGHEVVPIELDLCTDYAGGIAAVTADKATLYIDRTGRPINHEVYAGSYRFVGSDGLYPAKQGDKVGFIGSDGKVRIPPTYTAFMSPSDGAIPVVLDDGKWGIVDTTGKQLAPFEYTEIQELHGGIAYARKGDRWGVIDRTGKVIVPFEYGWLLGGTDDDLLAAQREFDKPPTLLFDHTGKLVATLPLQISESFREGLGMFEQHGKVGFVTPAGKVVVSPRFDSASHFSHGVAWVSRGDGYGLVDHAGKPVVPLRYRSVYDYAYVADGDDVVLVGDPANDKLTFYIDIQGHEYRSADTR